MLNLLLALALSPVLSAPQDAAPHPWLGCWQSEAKEETFWFEPDRCGRLREGRPVFYRVDYGEGRARLESWARFTELTGRIEGERLRLEIGGEAHDLGRVAIPDALRVEPYPLPIDPELDEDTVVVVGEELRERRKEDQRVRSGGGAPDPARMRKVDEDNTEFILNLVLELGWIDAGRFGEQAADAAFLIVQHTADLRLMRTALPRIEEDVRAGRLGGQAFALMFDRLQLRLGRLQRYGSQLGVTATQDYVMMPCEDRLRIDEYRSEMGMGPLAEYIALYEGEGREVLWLDELDDAGDAPSPTK